MFGRLLYLKHIHIKDVYQVSQLNCNAGNLNGEIKTHLNFVLNHVFTESIKYIELLYKLSII